MCHFVSRQRFAIFQVIENAGRAVSAYPVQEWGREPMTVIYTIAAVATASFFLFSALLVVCRGFALRTETREPYEARLWAKYATVPVDTKRAA